MDALLSLLTGGNSVFVLLGGALIAAFAAWARGRVTGARAERDRQARGRLETISEAQKIDDAIAGQDAETNRKELGRWSRG